MAAMATRKKNGPDQPIRSSSLALSFYKSLFSGGPSHPLLEEGFGMRREREGQVDGPLGKKEEDK